MSSALAIASVTQVLKDLLNNGIVDQDVTGIVNGNVTVTSLAPDLIDAGKDGPSQLNLFMYHVTENQGWRNQHYPALNKKGDRVTNPPLALNLHYLLTAYSPEELVGDVLLGYGMQLLHENPVLSRESIRKSLALPSVLSANGLPPNLQAIATSKLADQVEQVKLSMEPLNTEEMSRLWTAFQVKYRPTASYIATVVLIESEKSTRPALPVRQRNIYVKPFRQTTINAIRSQSSATAAALDGHKILHSHILVLEGHHMKGENTRINIDGHLYMPDAALVSNDQIRFALPAGLRAGLHGVQVVELYDMGTPETLHSGTASNVQAFILSPEIASATPLNLKTIAGRRSADIRIDVMPAIQDGQRVMLLMNQVNAAPDTAPAAYSFPGRLTSSPPEPASSIDIPVSGIRPGDYLLRLLVDGAESPLESDPATGNYNAPLITIA